MAKNPIDGMEQCEVVLIWLKHHCYELVFDERVGEYLEEMKFLWLGDQLLAHLLEFHQPWKEHFMMDENFLAFYLVSIDGAIDKVMKNFSYKLGFSWSYTRLLTGLDPGQVGFHLMLKLVNVKGVKCM